MVYPKQNKQALSNAASRTTNAKPKAEGTSFKTLRTSHKKSPTTQAKTKTLSKPVQPAKFVRPNPGSRHYGARGNQSTVSKGIVRKKTTGLDVKKRLNNTVAQSSGNGIEDYNNAGAWMGSTAATHAGTHVTGEDTMAKTIESRKNISAIEEDQYQPDVSYDSSLSKEIKATSFIDEIPKKRNSENDVTPARGCLGDHCLSGAIPDYIFICQNWY